jgi:hypothetical protein
MVGFLVVAHVLEVRGQLSERFCVDASVLRDAVTRPVAQLAKRAPGTGHADDRHLQMTRTNQRLQRREAQERRSDALWPKATPPYGYTGNSAQFLSRIIFRREKKPSTSRGDRLGTFQENRSTRLLRLRPGLCRDHEKLTCAHWLRCSGRPTKSADV